MKVDISEEIKDYNSWRKLVIYDLDTKDFSSDFEDVRLIRYIFEETVNYPEGLIYIERLFNEIYDLPDRDLITEINKVHIISGILKCLTYIEESKLGDAFERIFVKSIALDNLGIIKILIEFFDSGYSNKDCFRQLELKNIPEYLSKYFKSVKDNLNKEN